MSSQIIGFETRNTSLSSDTSINSGYFKSESRFNSLVTAKIVTDQLIFDLDHDRITEIEIGLRSALDQIANMSSGDTSEKTSKIMDLMELLKLTSSRSVWETVIVPGARSHDLCEIVQQCPFTRHSFQRPRGYPGDAGLLDFVYRHPDTDEAVAAATPVGRAVMDVTVNVPPCEAVRQRKDILSREIDEVAERREGAEILAVACGHLRETEGSRALHAGRIARLVASDQDESSLEKVEGYRRTVNDRIEPRTLSVRHLLMGGRSLGTFDLIYAAGLYDYLDERVAGRLTSGLFDMLKEGGKLVIPNFRDGIREEGYMDAFMDWRLIYRSRQQIEAFANGINASAARRTRYYEDVSASIGYLEVQKV